MHLRVLNGFFSHLIKKGMPSQNHLLQPSLLSFFFLLLFASVSFATPSSMIAEVVAVLEGDMIKVLKSRQVIVVRLQGIDTPDIEQRYSKQAKDFTEEISFGQKVVINLKGMDADGRLLAEVILEDGRSLNREIVKNGFAWWYRDDSEDLSLWRLENAAREAKLGLWLGEDPIAPWEFRAQMEGGR